jgi:cob(I)alamin adenosyltransferase
VTPPNATQAAAIEAALDAAEAALAAGTLTPEQHARTTALADQYVDQVVATSNDPALKAQHEYDKVVEDTITYLLKRVKALESRVELLDAGLRSGTELVCAELALAGQRLREGT